MGESEHIRAVNIMFINNLQSYGGFMSSKIMEAGAGVHSLAMAVAVCEVCFSSKYH